MTAQPTAKDLEADGFVIKIGEPGEDYHRTRFAHPVLHYSIAKHIITDCAEDARRRSAAGAPEDEEGETSDAMEGGNILDKLLTTRGGWTRSIDMHAHIVHLKTTASECRYADWNGFRVVEADSWANSAAKDLKATAPRGLTPILKHKLEKALEARDTIRARLELAGVDFSVGKCQVPLFWVEISDDGIPVQCAATLDQLIPRSVKGAASSDDYLIRDLKRTQSLNLQAFARQAYSLRYHMQAAVYQRAVQYLTGLPASFEWALVRYPLTAVARREPSQDLLNMGAAEWAHAVNVWGRCTSSGLWDSYELRGVELVHAEPYQLAAHQEWADAIEAQQEEVTRGNAA